MFFPVTKRMGLCWGLLLRCIERIFLVASVLLLLYHLWRQWIKHQDKHQNQQPTRLWNAEHHFYMTTKSMLSVKFSTLGIGPRVPLSIEPIALPSTIGLIPKCLFPLHVVLPSQSPRYIVPLGFLYRQNLVHLSFLRHLGLVPECLIY